jgi:transposase
MDTNGKRRTNKRWPETLKREVVAASVALGASVSTVARQDDVNANQVFSWRRRFGQASEAVQPSPPKVRPMLVPVTVSTEPETAGHHCRHLTAASRSKSPTPSDVRVWLAVGRTDMRRGMNGLALQVQEALQRDPHARDLFVFRGPRGDLIKILWHDGLGLSLYAKRLERGRFVWPPSIAGQSSEPRAPEELAVSIAPAQQAYLLSGIDWRNPVQTFRPQRAG